MDKETEQLNKRIDNLENMLKQVLTLVQVGSVAPVSSCQYTFGEWLIKWQEMYKRPKQGDETYYENLRRIENNIIPLLGDIKLTDLASDDLQDYINGLPVSNARDKISLLFSGSLRKAFDLGYITRNPYKAVENVKNKSESFPVIQPSTQLKLLKIIDNPKYLQMFIFYCCTGFRLSEGLSINPQKDIDHKRHVIMLRMPDQKTKKHQREVPFLPELLKNFDLTQSSLFSDITRNSARQYFSKLFKKHKIDAVIHSFRHTFISCCYHVGISEKHIQQWVGHSSIVMTMDTYTHILENKKSPIIEYLKQLKNDLKIK